MSIEARDEERTYGPRREGARRHGAYTPGSTAVRIGLFDDIDEDELDERLDDVDSARSRTGTMPRGASRLGTADRGVPGRGTLGRRTAGTPPRRSVPRPRRGRTAWVSGGPEAGRGGVTDVTPVGPSAVRGASKAPFLLFLVGLVVAGVVGVLVLNTKITENSFRLGDLRQTQANLSLQEQQLQEQLAVLESPGNLRAAATRLGLVPAGSPAYISLPDGRVVGVPQPAAGGETTEP